MSLECSECERDCRGQHDRSCSKYSNGLCACDHREALHDEEGCCTECVCIDYTDVSAGTKEAD